MGCDASRGASNQILACRKENQSKDSSAPKLTRQYRRLLCWGFSAGGAGPIPGHKRVSHSTAQTGRTKGWAGVTVWLFRDAVAVRGSADKKWKGSAQKKKKKKGRSCTRH